MWNGIFVAKSNINSVTFVPLVEMTRAQWRILEYENLRDIAKERIAEAVLAGDLQGFFHVNVTVKKAKPNYFWPATGGLIDAHVIGGDVVNFEDVFRNLRDIETTSSADKLDDAIGSFSSIRIFGATPGALAAMQDLAKQYGLPPIPTEPLGEIEEVDEDLYLAVEWFLLAKAAGWPVDEALNNLQDIEAELLDVEVDI